MNRITIVSGASGCGKTTLASALSRRRANGLHLVSDTFYSFPAKPIDPTTPASQAQNTVVMRALAAASGAFAEGGYWVFLDGIFGPWFLATLFERLPTALRIDYLLLRENRETARARVEAREGSADVERDALVERTHGAFADLSGFERHVFDVAALAPELLADRVERALESGSLQLDRRSVLASSGS